MTTFTGDEGNNTLIGGSDDDTLYGKGGSDILQGNDGDDVLNGGAGNDILGGGNGLDYANYADSPTSVTVNLTTGTATDGFGGTDTLLSIEKITGSMFDDTLTGNAQDNTFKALGGNNLVDGQDGINRISYIGASASVTVNLTTGTASNGFGGTDKLVNIQRVTGSHFGGSLTGNAQDNIFWVEGGNNLVDGRGGFNDINYRDAPTSVAVNLTTGTALNGFGGTDTLLNIHNISGSMYVDTLTGDSQWNWIVGSSGNDTLNGMDGIDTAVFGGNRANFTLLKSASTYLVTDNTGTDGTDTLTNVERLQFSDTKIALDLNAGQAMEFIGAIAPDLLNNTSVRGTIISLFDQGYTMESLSQLALNLQLLPTVTNAALANAVYQNVAGETSSTGMTSFLVAYIETYGQANFLATVAGMHLNVDLVGLQLTGVEYLI